MTTTPLPLQLGGRLGLLFLVWWLLRLHNRLGFRFLLGLFLLQCNLLLLLNRVHSDVRLHFLQGRCLRPCCSFRISPNREQRCCRGHRPEELPNSLCSRRCRQAVIEILGHSGDQPRGDFGISRRSRQDPCPNSVTSSILSSSPSSFPRTEAVPSPLL